MHGIKAEEQLEFIRCVGAAFGGGDAAKELCIELTKQAYSHDPGQLARALEEVTRKG